MLTQTINPDLVEKKWLLLDAEGQALGRIASRAAVLLRGKHKPQFHPSQDYGDNVVIVNADKIVLTGNKAEVKEYFSHSTYPGGGKFTSFKKLMAEEPTEPLYRAIKGMLPKNSLGRGMIKKLHLHAGPEHTHVAQKPEAVTF